MSSLQNQIIILNLCTKLKSMNNQWVSFTTETGLVAKYLVVGEDLRFDVKIKIITPMPKGYYHSAQNEAGAYYDKFIFPKLST